MYFSRKVRTRIDSIQYRFKSFVWQLEREHVEYDLGSEQVIKTLGSVQGEKLKVGNRAYGLVVIPASMENLDKTTYQLMVEFLAAGGRIISFASDIPYLDGAPSELINELLHRNPDQCFFVKEISDPLFQNAIAQDDFSITESTSGYGELYHQRRILDDGQLIMLVNSSEDQSATATIEAKGKSVISLDLISGEISQVVVKSRGKTISFQADLPPVGSAIYFISHSNSSLPFIKTKNGEGGLVASTKQLEISADQDNILVLNYLDLKSGDLELKDSYFMDALLALFDSHGLEMGNPWQHKIQYRQEYVARDSFPDNSGFSASYHFNISGETDPLTMDQIKAVVEGHELWDIYCNGELVEKEEGSYWIDRDFHYFPVGEYLKKGKNTLSLKASKMSLYAELMPVYLTGPFLLRPLDKGFEITDGALVSLGTWKDQGYPFYSQKVSYTEHFQIEELDREYVVRLQDWNGTTTEVYVNGQKAGQICWSPYELTVGHLLNEGDNQITVKVVGSLKNTFGHFFKTWESLLNGPGDWNVSPEGMPSMEQYSLMDYGLFEPFDLLMY